MLNKIKNFTVTGKEKAVAAFLVTTVTAYMAQNGLTWHDLLAWSALKALVAGVLAHAVVYFTSNSDIGA